MLNKYHELKTKYIGDINTDKQFHPTCGEIVCICFEQYPHVQAMVPNN